MIPLSAENLTIGYANKIIQEDLNLNLQEGELVCLLGRNGSGKTTLMRTLSAFQPSLGGKIHLFGKHIKDIPRTEMAFLLSVVLTEKIGIGNLKVETLISMGRYPYTNWWGDLTKEDKAKVEEAIELTGTSPLRNKFLLELSDGERQKVMIARALAQDTPLMFLDEATAHLDVPNRVEIMNLLRNLAIQTRKAILVSTHELDLALQCADRLWLLHPSKGFFSGIPEDMVLQGDFEKVFETKGFYFDKEKGLFKINVQKKREIYLEMEGENATLPLFWFQKALERKGYQLVQQEGAFKLSIHNTGRAHLYRLSNSGKVIDFQNIESLLSEILHEIP